MAIDNKEWLTIDVLGLSLTLAKDDFNRETAGIPESEIYETVIEDINGQMTARRIAKPEWAHRLFALAEGYKMLIESHKKK